MNALNGKPSHQLEAKSRTFTPSKCLKRKEIEVVREFFLCCTRWFSFGSKREAIGRFAYLIAKNQHPNQTQSDHRFPVDDVQRTNIHQFDLLSFTKRCTTVGKKTDSLYFATLEELQYVAHIAHQVRSFSSAFDRLASIDTSSETPPRDRLTNVCPERISSRAMS